MDDYRKIIKANTIQNNPVTLEDVQVAEEIFGPDVGSLKGKTTCKKAKPIVKNYVSVPSIII